MRVLLIVSTSGYGAVYPALLSNTDFPAGFPYLASALRASGHEVFGLNPNNDTNYSSANEMLRDKLSRSIIECQPDLIGLGGLCTDYRFLRDALRLCRKLVPNVPIICGGGIIQHDGSFIMDTLRPDFCIAGEGEEALVELAGMLQSGNGAFEKIPNMGYWKEGRATFTEKNFTYPDIDSRPFPDYEPFGIGEMIDKYAHAARNSYRYTRIKPRPMTIVTARGCPFRCTFCVHHEGPRYRARSVANIMQELEQMYERYRFNTLIILDELFAVNRFRLKEFCESMIDRRNSQGWDFDWCFQTHASASLTLEDLKMAKSAGCYYFSYGLESASPRVLASMNKKTRPSQILEAVNIAHEVKIGFGGNLIFGDIAETTETIIETMAFFKQYLLDDNVLMIPIQPYPGSKLFEYCIGRGIIRNKLEFYERGATGVFNMTSLPDALWFPWIHTIVTMNDSLTWVPATQAESFSMETETGGPHASEFPGPSIFRITARCVHCGMEVHCREPLEEHKESNLRRFLHSAFIAYRNEGNNLPRYLKRQVLPYIKRRVSLLGIDRSHHLFRLLENLRDNGEPGRWVFATGCPHCNKRFRVKVGAISGPTSRRPE